MANKVVSQMKKEEEELEALKKAYEDKKKEFANKKRAYTRLVNQTEDMKKELEGLYESLEKGPYKKTARFDSSIYDKIAELEEAIRVNDEKLGREKITYTETTTTTTRTVVVEGAEAETGSEEIDPPLLSDTAKKELEVSLGLLTNFENDLKAIKDSKENINFDNEQQKMDYIFSHNLVWKMRENLIKDITEKYPEVAEIVGDSKSISSEVLQSKLGIEGVNIEELSQEEKDWIKTGLGVRLIEAQDQWHEYWETKHQAQVETAAEDFDKDVKETITNIQDLVHTQVRKEFQYIGLDPALYLESEEEIDEARIPLTDDQKEMVEVSKDAVMAVLETDEELDYEKARDAFIKQIDLEKDTFKDETYGKIQDIKERLDIVLEGAGEETTLKNLRQQFKQKRAERQLANELGIKRKDLPLYQKAIDDCYDRFNGQGEYKKSDYRTLDLDTIVLISDVLEIDDEQIERFEKVNEISENAHKLKAYEKYVDAMTTREHVEDSKEALEDLHIFTVEAKNDEYNWDMLDVSKIDTADIERLDELGLEVHDLLGDVYEDFDEKAKAYDSRVNVIDKKYDVIHESIENSGSFLTEYFIKRYELEEEAEAGEEVGAEADASEAAEEDEENNL